MIIELGKYVVVMNNAFPPNIGLSRTYSACTIMPGKQLDFKKKCRCPFGDYVQAHVDRNVTKIMVGSTKGAICLGPMGNLQGSYDFLSLHTGRKITRIQFTELPPTPHVTQPVIAMSMNEKQQKGLVFKDRNGV